MSGAIVTARSEVRREAAIPPAAFHLGLAASITIAFVGIWVDAWAHINVQSSLEDVLHPWHAVLWLVSLLVEPAPFMATARSAATAPAPPPG